MSRNLCSRQCVCCPYDGDVALLEEPRPVTPGDAGVYFAEFSAQKLIVAIAQCPLCAAKYLAWVSLKGHTLGAYREENLSYIDLSFRSTFNDEPGPEDLPKYVVERVFRRVRDWGMPNDPFYAYRSRS